MTRLSSFLRGLGVAALVSILLAGCSNSDEPKQSEGELLLILGITTDRPRIKFINALLTVETYSVYNAGCSSTPLVSSGPVAAGAETQEFSIPGTLSFLVFSYNSPATSNCTQSGANFANGILLAPAVYTCRSRTGAITCVRPGETEIQLLK